MVGNTINNMPLDSVNHCIKLNIQWEICKAEVTSSQYELNYTIDT